MKSAVPALAIAVLALNLALAGPIDASTLTIKITRFTSPITRNSAAVVAVTTLARARCTIGVYYSTTPSKAAGLVAKTAPANGKITWTWKIGGNTKRGSWPVRIRCTLGSATKTVSRNIVVR